MRVCPIGLRIDQTDRVLWAAPWTAVGFANSCSMPMWICCVRWCGTSLRR